jgi:hypothetical protein
VHWDISGEAKGHGHFLCVPSGRVDHGQAPSLIWLPRTSPWHLVICSHVSSSLGLCIQGLGILPPFHYFLKRAQFGFCPDVAVTSSNCNRYVSPEGQPVHAAGTSQSKSLLAGAAAKRITNHEDPC